MSIDRRLLPHWCQQQRYQADLRETARWERTLERVRLHVARRRAALGPPAAGAEEIEPSLPLRWNGPARS